jgi:ketosteroid isomerase-like protein
MVENRQLSLPTVGDYMKSKSATDSSGALAATRLGTSSNEDTNAIESVLRQYVSLLDAGDADSISTKVYKAPILFLSLDGTHTTFPDTEAVSKFLKSYLDAQAKSGRTGTEIEKMQIKLLSENVALAFVDYLIRRTDGTTRTGWVYIFQKEAGSWRAASLAPRDLRTTVAREGPQ